jgi:hypothetical protein
MQITLVRRMLDAMHCENICKNVLKTLIGKKDTTTSKMDMQDRLIHPGPWPSRVQGNNKKLWMLDAPYALSPID